MVLDTWRMQGAVLDAKVEWAGFLANAHKRRANGETASAAEHDFRLWVSSTVRRERSSGRGASSRSRVVQGGPDTGAALRFDDPDAEFPELPEPKQKGA
jgi:hypothetical protein